MLRFRRALGEGDLLRNVERLLLGVSGGADSVALFRLFSELREAHAGAGFPQLIVGHVHHGIRGVEADLDEAFVRELAASRGVECLVARLDAVGESRRRGISVESAGRALRFGAFRQWARERSLDAVALAHHLDDQAETVLYRAARGTGIVGLAGIPRQRDLPSEERAVRIIRPLLSWGRESILQFLADRAQGYRADATNSDRGIPRNFLRHEVLPLLERGIHPGARKALARLSVLAGELARDLRCLGERALRESRRESRGGEVLLLVEHLRRWPPTVVHEALRLAAEDLHGRGGAPLSFSLSDRLQRGLMGDVPFKISCGAAAGEKVGAGLTIEMRYGLLRLRSSEPIRAPGGTQMAIPSVPCRAAWNEWEIAVEESDAGPGPGSSLTRGDLLATVDATKVREAGPLAIRSRRPGDRLWPLGAPGSKKLKELFRERRVWPGDRDRVPLIVAGSEIVWVVGHRVDHRFRLRPETSRVLILRATAASMQGGEGGSPPG